MKGYIIKHWNDEYKEWETDYYEGESLKKIVETFFLKDGKLLDFDVIDVDDKKEKVILNYYDDKKQRRKKIIFQSNEIELANIVSQFLKNNGVYNVLTRSILLES